MPTTDKFDNEKKIVTIVFFAFRSSSRSQGSGNLLLGHVSGRGSDGKHRFSLYGMVFKKDPDVSPLAANQLETR